MMVWISCWVDNKCVCSVGSFLGTLVDYGAVKDLDDIGFVQFKLQANYDEGVLANKSS